jgi:arsenite oxidase large subunit
MQGERRLRLYPQLVDAPGESRPDWQAVAGVAQRMGFAGFDWKDSNELFERCAARSEGPHAFQALIEYAADNRQNARQILRETGTTGLQCPLSYADGRITETVRYHDAEAGRGVSTPTGKACFVVSLWADVVSRQAELKPRADELWVLNRRASTNWSALVQDQRNPFRMEQLPLNYLEVHPDDASALGIEDGTPVAVINDGVSRGFRWNKQKSGRFEAVVLITDRVRRGVSCAYFNYGGDPDLAANSVVSNTVEPITNKNSFKLGRGRITPI